MQKLKHKKFHINSSILQQIHRFLEKGFFNLRLNRHKDHQIYVDTTIKFTGEDIGNMSDS